MDINTALTHVLQNATNSTEKLDVSNCPIIMVLFHRHAVYHNMVSVGLMNTLHGET